MLSGGGVCVVGFMKGSGLRSEGGMRSGLEDPDLLGFLVNSTDFTLPDIGTEPTCELGAGLLEWLVRGGVLLVLVFGSAVSDCACDKGLALDSTVISFAVSSGPSVGNCPPRCIRMWC